MADKITNIVVAGIGGQGVLKSSDMLSWAALLAGYDVKKAEIRGMSQRGGPVTSDVRFGDKVLSPMVPPGEADYLVVLETTQVEPTRHRLREDGRLLHAGLVDPKKLPTPKALNVAMLGMLSVFLDIPEQLWHQAVRTFLPERLHGANVKAFEMGRSMGESQSHYFGSSVGCGKSTRQAFILR